MLKFYCESCDKLRPIKIDPPDRDIIYDIVCAKCNEVLATINIDQREGPILYDIVFAFDSDTSDDKHLKWSTFVAKGWRALARLLEDEEVRE